MYTLLRDYRNCLLGRGFSVSPVVTDVYLYGMGWHIDITFKEKVATVLYVNHRWYVYKNDTPEFYPTFNLAKTACNLYLDTWGLTKK